MNVIETTNYLLKRAIDNIELMCVFVSLLFVSYSQDAKWPRKRQRRKI